MVIGPDDVLASGIVNSLQAAGIKVFGPAREAAEIEWSKSFAKDLMKRLGIPTARAEEFTEIKLAKDYAKNSDYPLVIKASGLALGKGVVIANSYEETAAALEEMLVKKVFGPAGETVIIEEFLQGIEISIHAFCDGKTFSLFPAAQDHKRIFDNDQGPNTGGMGTVAPVPGVSREVLQEIKEKIIAPVLSGLKNMGREFKGILFPGIMLTKDGPKVLEFNARFGDPETQSYMRLLKTDLVDILLACTDGRLADLKIDWQENLSICCVILASAGYPVTYKKGFPIRGIEEAEEDKDVVIFHAGTKIINNNLVTNGGRVLGVSATGSTLEDARQKAYKAVALIDFEGKQFRKDIV